VDRKEVIVQSYSLGYEVGYYKHYEIMGWVYEDKNRIFKKAEELGILEVVRKAYQEGRRDGERAWRKAFLEGMLREEERTEEDWRRTYQLAMHRLPGNVRPPPMNDLPPMFDMDKIIRFLSML